MLSIICQRLGSSPTLRVKCVGTREIITKNSALRPHFAVKCVWGKVHLIDFFYAYSNGKPPTVRHPSKETATLRLWRGCAWIRHRNLQAWDLETEVRRWASVSIFCQTESEVVGLSGPWMVYCCVITIWVPTFLMRQCGGLWCRCYLSSHLDNPLALGLCSPEQQHARREKMGLLSFILTLMAGVGFTEAVHGTLATRFHGVLSSRDSVLSMPIVIHGYRYDFKPLPQRDSMAFPWRCHKSLWFNHNWCKQFSRLVYALQHP